MATDPYGMEIELPADSTPVHQFPGVTRLAMERVAEILAGGMTPAALEAVQTAAEGVVAEELADAGVMRGAGTVYPETDSPAFTIVDATGHRSWLEIAGDGGPTENTKTILSGALSTPAQVPDAGGVVFAVTDSAGHMSWLQVAADGGPTADAKSIIAAAAAGTDIASPQFGPVPSWSTKKSIWNPDLATYNFHSRNGRKADAALARAAAGTGTGHFSAFLDSRTYGAAASGVSQPKWLNSWPGRLRRMLNAWAGYDGGTGIACPWNVLFATPADDPRWTWGSGVTSHVPAGNTSGAGFPGYGALGLSCARLDNSAGNGWVTFTPPAAVDRFSVFLMADAASAGLATLKVDGATVGTVSLAPVASGGTLARRAGYAANQIIVDVTGLALANHTLRIEGAAGEITNLIWCEGGTGKGIRVSNLARSSTQLSHYVLDDANKRYGMPVHTDAARADVQLLMPISNDRTAAAASVKAWLATAIDRQTAAGGETVLIAPCQPDYVALGSGTEANWLSIVTAMYELADEKDVRLIDLTWAWQNFATSNALGLFGDTIHENDTGSELLARTVFHALTKG